MVSENIIRKFVARIKEKYDAISESTIEKELDIKKIINKIISSKSFVKGLSKKIKENIEMLTNNKDSIIEEKSKLSLIKINEEKYLKFEERIIPFIIKIGEDANKQVDPHLKLKNEQPI